MLRPLERQAAQRWRPIAMKLRPTLATILMTLASAAATQAQVPHFGHVVIVLGENAGFSQTYQSGEMPYLDSLAAKYGLAANYYADTHPSIGNYEVLTAGQIFTN